MSSATKDRVPVTIVTGFLGAGKTTLLNYALTNGKFGRVAALVNDFGAIDIDAALVAEVADEVVTLQNGCICCTINGDLYRAVERVLSLEPPVERIVVETTGVADPLPVGLTFLETDIAVHTTLESVVTVVDCANFALDLFKANAAMAQIVHSDIIILNKTDLADRVKINTVRRRIGLIKPRTLVLEAEHGRIPLASIFSSASEPSLQQHPSECDHGEHGEHSHHHHLLDDGFISASFQYSVSLSSERFQAWLDLGLPSQVFRAKGIVRFDGGGNYFVFQYCGGRVNFHAYEGTVRDTRLVFIGQRLNMVELERCVQRCLAA